MSRMVRGALLQVTWTGDQHSMIDQHVRYARRAAQEGAQIICFQELFCTPYFCQVQNPEWYAISEPIPDGPTTRLMQDLARETKMVLVVPLYERDEPGICYNSAAVIDADGTYLGKYRKTHIPQGSGFWEKDYFRPGNLGYPVFETAVGRIGVCICYDRHFPEGARLLGLAGAELVMIPASVSRGSTEPLWHIEQPAHAAANGYFVGSANRVGAEAEFGSATFFGQSYFCDPRGQVCGAVASADREELIIRDLDLDLIGEVRAAWQFYRDRRPDLYAGLAEP